MNIRNQLPIPLLRLLEESSPALPEEDANQRNNSVQSHLHRRLLDSGRPTAGLDGGVEVEITEKPPLQENATIPCDVVSNAHLVDLHDHPRGNFLNLPSLPSAYMYVLVTKPVPVSVQLQTQK